MLAYSERGAGEPLVLLHGIGADRRRWDPLVDLLSDSFRCVAVDLPGHGASPAEGCDLLSATVAVHELVEHLGLASPVVVGHSLGASAVLLYGALFAPRSVVSIDPVGLHLPHLAASLAPYADRLRGEGFAAAFAEWEEQFQVELVPAQLREAMQHTAPPRQEVVLSYWQTALDPAACEAAQPAFAGALASITAPTLVCLAQPPTPEDAAVLATMPSTQVEVHVGKGHYLHLVDVEGFCRRLRQWVQAPGSVPAG